MTRANGPVTTMCGQNNVTYTTLTLVCWESAILVLSPNYRDPTECVVPVVMTNVAGAIHRVVNCPEVETPWLLGRRTFFSVARRKDAA